MTILYFICVSWFLFTALMVVWGYFYVLRNKELFEKFVVGTSEDVLFEQLNLFYSKAKHKLILHHLIIQPMSSLMFIIKFIVSTTFLLLGYGSLLWGLLIFILIAKVMFVYEFIYRVNKMIQEEE